MPIYAYKSAKGQDISAKRYTSEGKWYSINHSESLIVNMRYWGYSRANVNSQGWERSSSYYFGEMLERHPEFFSKKNTLRIQNKEAPKVDSRFVEFFPQYEQYKNEVLVHHHIGNNGQAVALPQSIHKGYGEIHAVEKELGITEEAERFSNLCQQQCSVDNTMLGKTADCYKEVISMEKNNSAGHVLSRKRVLTPEMIRSRNRDTEEVLENYRQNLYDHGVTDERTIERFIAEERIKINREYDCLDNGETVEDPYVTPTDWEGIAETMKIDGSESRPENCFSSAIDGSPDESSSVQVSNAFTECSDLEQHYPSNLSENPFVGATLVNQEENANTGSLEHTVANEYSA